MAAPTQLKLPQHGVDAEDSRLFQHIRVQDPVLPPQLPYSTKKTEVEVVDSPRLLLVYHPGLLSVQQRRQDDCPVHLQPGVEMGTVTVPDDVL
ncbi:hypothetical protein SprV_0100211100 [Sparganum proliferum]